jgi:hypothetical protein
MVKCQKIKLEFTSNTSQTININTDLYSKNIICAAKAAGKIGNDFFTAKYKFNINTQNLSITDIHFFSVSNVDKNGISQINNPIDFLNIINNTFEQAIYSYLYDMLTTAIINNSIITLTNTNIDYLVLHIKIGSDNYNSSSYTDEKSIVNEISQYNDKKSNSNVPNSNVPSSNESSSNESSSNVSSSNETSSNESSSSRHSIIIKSKKSKRVSENTLKLVTWSSMMSVVIHILKSITRNKK